MSYFKSAMQEFRDNVEIKDTTDPEDQEVECSVCLDDYKPSQMRLLEGCSHTFCAGCLKEALALKKECPQCRQPVSGGYEKSANLGEVLRSYCVYEKHVQKGNIVNDDLFQNPGDSSTGPDAAGVAGEKGAGAPDLNLNKGIGLAPGSSSSSSNCANKQHQSSLPKSWLDDEDGAFDLNENERLGNFGRLDFKEAHGSKMHALSRVLRQIFESNSLLNEEEKLENEQDLDPDENGNQKNHTKNLPNKVIIFVQFPELLTKIVLALQDYGYVEGTHVVRNIRHHPKELKRFQDSKDANMKILLLSLDKEASGLNLTSANHVLLVHPMCVENLDKACSAELQAVARVKRLGQNRRRVHLWRFVTLHTIEEDLIKEHRGEIESRRKTKEEHAERVREREQEYNEKDAKLKTKFSVKTEERDLENLNNSNLDDFENEPNESDFGALSDDRECEEDDLLKGNTGQTKATSSSSSSSAAAPSVNPGDESVSEEVREKWAEHLKKHGKKAKVTSTTMSKMILERKISESNSNTTRTVTSKLFGLGNIKHFNINREPAGSSEPSNTSNQIRSNQNSNDMSSNPPHLETHNNNNNTSNSNSNFNLLDENFGNLDHDEELKKVLALSRLEAELQGVDVDFEPPPKRARVGLQNVSTGSSSNSNQPGSANPIPAPTIYDEQVCQLIAMGFSDEQALDALRQTNGNLQAALEKLL